MTCDTINNDVTIAGGGGTLLANRYRVVRQLGQGGMGSVWLAEDTQLDNKPFAIKMLPAILVSNKRAYRQLKDEALVAMKLTHPNIVTLRAFEENNGNPFLVMDYINGETLDDYLAEKGKLSEAETIRLLRPIAAALDYAHAKGVVHRDVKPGNVMVANDGTTYILDFGIAREIQETMTRVTGKLSSGTLLYMSPEQLHGAAPKKEQDIYSFADMAYECLKGEPPFSRGQIEFQIDNDTPEPLGLTGEAAILAAGVMQGLAKKPEDRPPTCAAVLSGRGFSRVERAERVESNEGGSRSNGSLGKVVGVLAFFAALVVGGYYVWTKYDFGTQEKQSGNPAFPEPKPPVESKPPAEPKPPSIDEVDIIEIRVQAAKCENAMGRISDEDGFALKKASLSDDLAAARAYDSSRSWGRAAAAYTNYVNSCNALAQMNKDRIDARSKRDAAYKARQTASDTSASQYALPRWNEAERLFNAAKAAWSGMDFIDSSKKYDLAAKQYVLAKDEAVKEHGRQVDEQREKERKAAAELERRKNWPVEGREFTIDRYSLGMTMKWCPAGSFMMGSPTTEEGRFDDETEHRVSITKGFWMGETEVTQGQWKRLMNGETILGLARKVLQDEDEYLIGGKKRKPRDAFSKSKYSDPQEICGDISDNAPIYYVSWNEAVEFCRRLTQKESAEGRIPDGYEYRLPTEAEWEYACRVSRTTALPNGKAIRILGANNAPALDDIAWYGGNSSVGFDGRGWDTSNWKERQYDDKKEAAPREIKGKRANDWGLYDMIGNVWEWCWDYYGGYPTGVVTDPCNTTYHVGRVIRGGGWNNGARYCRAAARARNEPSLRINILGFRVALAPILSKDSGDVGASLEALASDKIQTNLVRVSANGGESAADTSSDALLYNESPQFVVHETQPATLTDTTELQRKYNAKHGLSGTHRPSDDSDLIEGKEDAESARLRREMVEQQRRRLYPEYYENHPQKDSGNMRAHYVIENALTELEKYEGWNLLWDGRTFNGWLAVKSGCKEPPQKGWIIKDGCLTMLPSSRVVNGKWSPLPSEEQKLGGGGDIVTVKKFRDFVFKFDFRLTKNATSGVKYFYDETLNKGTSEEYQILECGHPDFNKGKDGNRRSAALYDILPANADRILKDVGEWNTGMIVANGAHVEHWLNGEKVLEYERGSDAFKAAVKASKYASWGVDAAGKPQDWGEIPEGRILLQDHTDSMVSFRNLKIKKL